MKSSLYIAFEFAAMQLKASVEADVPGSAPYLYMVTGVCTCDEIGAGHMLYVQRCETTYDE